MTVHSGTTIEGRPLLDGEANGSALVLDEPLSFWGGLDPHDGRIIDAHHPQCGTCMTGRVLVLPAGRGSSSSSSVLAEAIRLGTGPAAILIGEPDEILVLGALVAAELYDTVCPMIAVPVEALARIADDDQVTVTPGGQISVIALEAQR
jgi:predicted aconitase with swiveling domain